MNISVIIPAYNEENYIGDCIRSVLKYAPENLAEIIVVNNASTDKTAEVASQFPKVRVVSEPQKGLTKARQRGLQEARGDILAYVDADNRIDSGWFNVLNREFGNNPRLVGLSGPYYYNFPEPKSRLVKVWRRSWLNLWYWFVYTISGSRKGYVFHGGNFAARKQTLEAIGGFDTSIEFYGEDTNIARRLREAGDVRFVRDFWVSSSTRRFVSEGLVVTGVRYLANYLSEIFLKKPVTKSYKDIR